MTTADVGTSSSKNRSPPARRRKDRLRVLAEAMGAFAEATSDAQRLLETVARRVAEVVKDYCIVLLLSDDGLTLIPAAAFDPDPEALRQLNDAYLEPVKLADHPLSRGVIETGQAHLATVLDREKLRPPGTTPRFFQLIEQVGIHSVLVVALRSHGRSIGVLTLARFRPDSPPFDEEDRDLAQNLASQAALAISNARLLTDARRERAEGQRVADRLRVLAEAAHEFSSATYDYPRLLDVVARRLGELVGDLCAIRAVTEDGEWLEATGAVYHRDPELLAVAMEVQKSSRQRVGEGLSGRAAASGQAVLTPRVSTAELIAASDPRYRPLLERLGVTSSITLPLLCQGKVVGVANLLRSGSGAPYDEDDLRFAQSIADHAALAIGNARAYAGERRARETAEQATAARRASEARFARLSDSGMIGIVVGDLSGRILEINDTLLRLVGYSRDEVLSGAVNWRGLTPPEWHEVDTRALAQLNASGIGALREKEYLRKDGGRVPVLIGSAMLEGTRTESISFVLDLSERKEAQAAIADLRRQRADDVRFRALLEAAPDGMIIVGEDGAIVLVNRQLEALFGYTREELIGEPIERLLPERQRSAHPSLRTGYFRSPATTRPMGQGIELRGRRKDGSEFPVEISLSPLETERGMLVSAAIRDISARTRAEEQRARLAAIVEGSADAIIGKNLDGEITSWNEGAHRLFGYTHAEIVGRSITVIIAPGDEARERLALEAVTRGEVQHFDTVRRCKDGTLIEVSEVVSPVRDVTGRVVGASKVARDITERRRAEQRLASAKESAEAATRELEAFSYSVAHDLRAPLRGVNGFAQILLDDHAGNLDAEGLDCLQEIVGSAQRMGTLIDALLSLSQVTRTELRTRRTDLSGLFRTIAGALAAREPARALELVVQERVSADVDSNLVRALFDNLIGNAWKFTGREPVARIELGASERDGALTLFIRDNGAGFDMAYASKLFSPFQRLHSLSDFPGTGIGLATSQRIVQRHGGRIWAEGKEGEGAVFYFTLPGAARGAA